MERCLDFKEVDFKEVDLKNSKMSNVLYFALN